MLPHAPRFAVPLVAAAMAFSVIQDWRGGFFSWPGLVGLAVGVAVLVAVLVGWGRLQVGVKALFVPWLVVEAMQFLLGGRFYLVGPAWAWRHTELAVVVLAAWCMLMAVLGWLYIVLEDGSVRRAYRLALLAGVAAIGCVAVLSTPVISDVQQYQDQAAARILAGEALNGDEYVIDGPFTASREYPYMPFEAVLRAPFAFLDTRLAGLVALLLSYPVVVALARSAGLGGSAPDLVASTVLVLSCPLYVLQQSWTEPLVPAFLAAGLLLHARGRWVVAGIAFGLAAALKLWLLILIPAAWSLDRRTGVVAAGTVIATVLPFAIQDAAGLVNGTVLFHFGLLPRVDGLILARLVPGWPLAVGAVAWLAAGLVLVVRRPAQPLVVVALGLAGLFFLGRQGNPNYWWLLPHLLVIGSLAVPTPAPDAGGSVLPASAGLDLSRRMEG